MTDGPAKFAAIAIGRNEGERLRRCLASLSSASKIVYVDSGSTDQSVEWAHAHGIDVVVLDMNAPFTAARARNSGFRRLCEIGCVAPYVQFIDGDCELSWQWPTEAVAFLDRHDRVAAVCGRTRERFPQRSIYNWLCDIEWNVPAGEVRAFAGAVMIRAEALRGVSGYRDDLIAGEEPELSVRLRAAGWRIWRLKADMISHDAAMTRFGQWWRRVVRSGYAFAQGAHLHGAPPERHWVWESRRALLWGLWLPLACIVATIAVPPYGFLAWLIFPAQVLRQTVRNSGPLGHRATLAFFQVLARFPEALGQLKFQRDRLFRTQSRLIEYK